MSLRKRLFNQGKRIFDEKMDKYIDGESCAICSNDIEGKTYEINLNGSMENVCSICMKNIGQVRSEKALNGEFDEFVDIGQIRSMYSVPQKQSMEDFMNE